jgi:cellulose synthase/poly-beta-1,6-N-acetylglucosamine synthase-like glycosyltransferase
MANAASLALFYKDPQLCAMGGATPGQLACLALLLLAMATATIAEVADVVLLALLGPLFLVQVYIQLAASLEFVAVHAEPEPCRSDGELPLYTVLVALYDEATVVDDLVTALSSIDYPPDRLQVLFAVEEEDAATRAALSATRLPQHMRVFRVPAGEPRTKPRALNAALAVARGTFVVVYDAEDVPDPLQLRAAVGAFRAADARLGCLQARLAIDNAAESWLTRLFAIEYAGLFDVVKAGFARVHLPIPLGGSSNHMRTAVLREVGGWDAWNVTEDADLGVRLARAGYRVGDLPSTTWEEAPASLRAWFRQRIRWQKGWMQTAITHTREPVRTIRELGLFNSLVLGTMVVGSIIGALGLPIFVPLLAGWLDTGLDWSDRPWIFVGQVVAWLVWAGGLAAVIVPPFVGIWRRRWPAMLPWLLVLPVYVCLISIAAWFALFALIRSPYAWSKTVHGVTSNARRRAGRDQKQVIRPESMVATKASSP